MGRPARAATASTRIVGFRLTEDEEQRLDELVADLGHKDRSALLRAWLVQAGPAELATRNELHDQTRDTAADDDRALSALGELVSREPPGSLLSIRALRTAVQPLPKPRFDAAVLRLSRAGKVILHHHDFPTSLPEAERAMLVRDERGTHYIGIAPTKDFRSTKRNQERRGVPSLVGLSLEDFALRVQSAANGSRNGWPNPGSDKIFVSVLFAELDANGSTAGLDIDTFKARLVEAHRASLLSLSRCDLVEAASPADVEASEIRYLSAEWHLVRRS